MQQFIEEAGAIVLRKNAGIIEVLLILSKKTPRMRIFPKGHIEPGETPEEAAQRELLEEAGVKGHFLGNAGVISYEFREKWYRVAYFYYDFEQNVSEGETGRFPTWYSLAAAHEVIELTDLQVLICPASIKAHGFLVTEISPAL